MNAICFLTDTNRFAGVPVYGKGASGAEYLFMWSAKYNRHILNGRELVPDDNKILFDLNCAVDPSFHAVVEILADEPKPVEVAKVETVPPVVVSEKTETVEPLWAGPAESAGVGEKQLRTRKGK